MKPRLLEYLACPECQGAFTLRVDERDGDEVMAGELRCGGCASAFAILRGVPRLVHAQASDLSQEVAESFGWEWNTFDELRGEYRQQFLDWVSPLEPSDFAGKIVLEGGCGKGRHSALAAEFGAREVLAVDLGSAVEAAFKNTRRLPSVHVIQGDVTRLPLKPVADLAFSVGVIHHLPEPRLGVEGLLAKLKPGGSLTLWVYAREGNEWIVDYVDPVRERLTSRMPRRALYEASRPLALALALAAKGVYAPLSRRGGLGGALYRRLFYREYTRYIARLPLREIHSIVFDHLVTRVAHYVSRDEVEAWLDDPRIAEVHIDSHNANSWRATARLKPG